MVDFLNAGFGWKVFELQQSGNGEEGLWPAYTKDGLLDRYGKPAVRGRTGGWKSGLFLLGIFSLNCDSFPSIGSSSSMAIFDENPKSI